MEEKLLLGYTILEEIFQLKKERKIAAFGIIRLRELKSQKEICMCSLILGPRLFIDA